MRRVLKGIIPQSNTNPTEHPKVKQKIEPAPCPVHLARDRARMQKQQGGGDHSPSLSLPLEESSCASAPVGST